MQLPVPKFSLIGASTKAGMLASPLRDRFGVLCRLENYTAEEIRAKFDYEIEDENLEYYRRNTCYNDIFEELALESWLYNHCTDVPFVTFALQGIQNEAERYRYLQWLKAEIK